MGPIKDRTRLHSDYLVCSGRGRHGACLFVSETVKVCRCAERRADVAGLNIAHTKISVYPIIRGQSQ